MRVLVASDSVGALSSRQAGRALAAGWPRARVAVVPVGSAGAGFVAASADLWDAPLDTAVVDGVVVTATRGADAAALRVEQSGPPGSGLPLTTSSAPLGAALARLLDGPPLRRVHLDLTGVDVHDGGAGLLAALGAVGDVPLDAGVAGLAGLDRIDLTAARDRLAGCELVGVVPADERDRLLLGLRGITSLRGRAADLDPAVLLRTDADLQRLAERSAPGAATVPGSGACGGIGLAVLALGGRLDTGPTVTLTEPSVARTVAAADLVVTGCTVFDFARRGGGVVAALAAAAAEALAPCVLVAGEVLVGSREMRTMGIEAAYPVRSSTVPGTGGGDVSADELSDAARRVGRSWSW